MCSNRLKKKLIGLSGITLLVILGLRFFWLTPYQATLWVIHGSYWVLTGLILGIGIFLIRQFHRSKFYEFIRDWKVWSVLIVLAVLLQVHEPHRLKVNYDENVLMSISRSMHQEHKAAWAASARSYFGSVTPIAMMADKRPVLFPYLVSWLHTLTGYRVANAWILNGFISGLFLIGLYQLGRQSRRREGLLLAILLAGVPLVAQNATGGGFDLLNATLIVFLAVAARSYFDKPEAARLTILTLLSLLLANTRYESIVYVLVPALAFIYTWWRQREMPEFPAWLTIAPLGLLPPLLSNAVFQSSETFFQMPKGEFWKWQNFPDNFSHAIYYLFDASPGGTNSILLAVLGVLALATLLIVFRRLGIQSREVSPAHKSLLLIGGIIGINSILMMGLTWGQWTDPSVSRFTLPFWLLLGWAGVEITRVCEQEWKRSLFNLLIYVAVGYLCIFSLPSASLSRQTAKLKAGTALEWAIDEVKKYDSRRSVLVLAESSIPYINEGYASLPLAKSVINFEKYAATVEYGLYRDVLVVLEEKRNREDGKWVCNEKMEFFIQRARVEPLAKMTFDPFYRMTILRVIKMDDPSKSSPWPKTVEGREFPDPYIKRVYDLMP